jgi:hypothetical protein
MGSIFVATNKARILNVPGLQISAAPGELAVMLFDADLNSGRHVTIEIEPELSVTTFEANKEPVFLHSNPRYGQVIGWGEVAQEAAGHAVDDAWRRIVHDGKKYSLREVIPSEDVRLADADGNLFAVIGLSVAGDPSIALVDNSEHPQAVWSVNRIGGSVTHLFRRQGELRVVLSRLPEKRPDLRMFEGYMPFAGSAEAAVTERLNSFAVNTLASFSPDGEVSRSLVLRDQRGADLWRSASEPISR